jgi:hypothetical protein
MKLRLEQYLLYMHLVAAMLLRWMTLLNNPDPGPTGGEFSAVATITVCRGVTMSSFLVSKNQIRASHPKLSLHRSFRTTLTNRFLAALRCQPQLQQLSKTLNSQRTILHTALSGNFGF